MAIAEDSDVVDILHISASPKGEQSVSDRMAEAFLGAYRANHPQDEVRRLNVFEANLPEVGADEAFAKFARIYGETPTPEQAAAWTRIVALIEEFDRADKIVISCPMWNMGIPWRLKLYFDCIVQPGVTFSRDPTSRKHAGLLRNRPVQLLLTRSSTAPGVYHDFQMPYLTFMLFFMGIEDVRNVVAWQTTKYDPTERAAYVQWAEGEAAKAGKAF